MPCQFPLCIPLRLQTVTACSLVTGDLPDVRCERTSSVSYTHIYIWPYWPWKQILAMQACANNFIAKVASVHLCRSSMKPLAGLARRARSRRCPAGLVPCAPWHIFTHPFSFILLRTDLPYFELRYFELRTHFMYFAGHRTSTVRPASPTLTSDTTTLAYSDLISTSDTVT